MSQHTITSHRRNGKLQSCEPCRKRKLSCDHKLPTCGRCVKRGTTRECLYHPAPMTKNGRIGPKSTSPRTTPRPGSYTPTGSREEHILAQSQHNGPASSQRLNFDGVVHDG